VDNLTHAWITHTDLQDLLSTDPLSLMEVIHNIYFETVHWLISLKFMNPIIEGLRTRVV